MQNFHVRGIGRVLLAATVLGAAACSDEQSALPTEGTPEQFASQAGATPANHQLASMLAAALRDSGVRAALRRDMAASPVAEHKLHFSMYLNGKGAPLLVAMARAGGLSEAQVLQLFTQTGGLEIYFPVSAHREAWFGGGNDLIVATTLEEWAAPFGVTLGGKTLTLSAETPPATPALVIVPAEGFDGFGQPIQSSLRPEYQHAKNSLFNVRGALSAATSTYRGIGVSERANYIRNTNDHEPWTSGNPEFEILLAATTSDGTQYKWNKPIPSHVWDPDSDDGKWRTLGSNSFEMIYYNQDYGTNIGFKCIERDGSGFNFDIKFSGSSTFKISEGNSIGVTINAGWKYDDSDDPCGEDYLYPRIKDPAAPDFYQWTELPGTVNNPEDGTSELMYRHF